ncbi:MAG TPA: uracil-DNA glycosylase [Anaerolineaceae bacterium]|nr:uracil-DNA glycosylase [Anaerolineaceae bacterium]
MLNEITFETLGKEIITCRKCPRLVEWREKVGVVKRRAFRNEDYWAKPVPGFGDPEARVLVLGLAPGAHGSNRSGRMFTGDDSGNFLYPALYRAGFANQPYARSVDDGLLLNQLYISAVCRCVPPDNKPAPGEIRACRKFLEHELDLLTQLVGIVALGKIAFDAIKRMFYTQGDPKGAARFGHGVFMDGCNEKPWVLGSYHPSRQNTQTGRLTHQMFDEIWQKVNQLLG